MRHATTKERAIAVCIDTRDGQGRYRLQGVARSLRQLGWRMMLVRQRGRSAAAEVAQLAPDGIVTYIADRWLLDVSRRLGVPLVDTAVSDAAVSMVVSIDNRKIAELAFEHLSAAGLTHFGYVGVRRRMVSEQRRALFAEYVGKERLSSFADRMSEGESRLEPLMRWLRQLPKPAGILAFDDQMGERVLTACRWAELGVPEQVAVLGIGNDELMCEVSHPSLSSVSLPTVRVGVEAARMLAEAIERRRIAEPNRLVQPTGVVARGSTDTMAIEDVLVKQAVQYIRAHAGELIGVKHVAQAMRISRRTLDRRCEAALGRTAHDEMARRRMQMARALLTLDDRSVVDVARRCGYGNAASFSRAFRRNAGCWPTEYRSRSG